MEQYQKTVSDFFSAIDGDITSVEKAHTEALARDGLNVNYIHFWYVTLKDLRYALKTETRSSESDMNEIIEKKNAYIKAGEKFLNSQKGLENFLTDQSKKDDPFLEEFYNLHKGFVAGANRLVDDQTYLEEYFKQENADVFARFSVVLGDITERANALEARKP
jgi:hypothetical protein